MPDYNLRFLESAENVKESLRRVTGRVPNTDTARGVSVCLQQGRMYIEAANSAPIEIRPLLLFYGMSALAKAVVAGITMRSLSTLAQAHGLHDISENNSRLENLIVRVDGRGTFQEFNDVVCEFDGLNYYENTAKKKITTPTAKSDLFTGVSISLKEIFSRVPKLEDIYQRTFGEVAKTHGFALHLDGHGERCPVIIRVDVSEIWTDRASLQQIVETLRVRFPMLRKWRLNSSQIAWDKSILEFSNTRLNGLSEFDEAGLAQRHGQFSAVYNEGDPYIDFRTLLDPVAGGMLGGYPAFINPLHGQHICELSLYYMGMYLLSSLVRYRPQIWVHSVSRLSNNDRPADDQALALTEQFMHLASGRFLDATVRLLSPNN